jgi:diguanylate cyclase (GGDEF)-like protein
MNSRPLHQLIFAVLLLIVPTAGMPADYESLLREADKVRSSEPKRFLELVRLMKERRQEADLGQRQRLQYLDAYRLVLYANSVDAGIKQAKVLFREAKDPDLKFRAGSFVVNSLAINRNFTEGLRFLNQTLAMRHDVKDQDIRHDGVNVAAALYNQLGQYKLGLVYAEETLSRNPNPRSRCFASLFRVEAQYFLNRLPQDEASIASVVDQCVALGENIPANFSRAILARQLAGQGRRDDAIELLRAHMPEVDELGYARLIAEFRSLLAELSLQRGEQEAAEQHAEAAVAQAPHVASSQPLAVAYRTLYELAELRGDTVSALLHYRQFAEADKAWLNEVKARELAYQIVRQETSQKNQQIELLNKQNELLQLQQQVQKQNAQNTRLLVLLLLLLLASIGYWAYKTKRVQMSLRRMAETDALTGICNRHHFTQQSELALTQYARAGEDVALVMFDLDHFKSINDRFGHVTGDWVLRHISDACKHFCRRIDHLGRIGGEEFAILLAGCDLRQATRIAEDCRVRIASIDTQPSGYKFVVTASFGVTATSLSGYDLTKLLSHADQMLYRAKREGRNRVFAYDGDTASEFKEHAATRQEELLLVPEGQQPAELPRIA